MSHWACICAECESLRIDAARYRFIRQSEADLDPKREEILAAVWAEIGLKGARMDEIIDDGIKAAAEATKEIVHGG